MRTAQKPVHNRAVVNGFFARSGRFGRPDQSGFIRPRLISRKPFVLHLSARRGADRPAQEYFCSDAFCTWDAVTYTRPVCPEFRANSGERKSGVRLSFPARIFSSGLARDGVRGVSTTARSLRRGAVARVRGMPLQIPANEKAAWRCLIRRGYFRPAWRATASGGLSTTARSLRRGAVAYTRPVCPEFRANSGERKTGVRLSFQARGRIYTPRKFSRGCGTCRESS